MCYDKLVPSKQPRPTRVTVSSSESSWIISFPTIEHWYRKLSLSFRVEVDRKMPLKELSVGRGRAAVFICFVMMLSADGRVNKAPQPDRMALWIDGKQIERFAGVSMDIFIIKNGAVVSYLQDAYFDSQLPILPSEVDFVELTWKAELEPYMYKFSDLRSLEPQTLYDPLLSIPAAGVVPKKKSVFQLAIPCTGKVTGIASMYIVLQVYTARGERVPGAPLKFHLRKRCIAFESRKACKLSCKNGGKCNENGRCDCKHGYYGLRCENAVCFPQCMNNGTCVSPGKCSCRQGFHGSRCELASCKQSCLNGGFCAEPDVCRCPATHYGDHCQHQSGICDIPCINGGTCNHHNVCTCPSGYSGQFCQKPLCKRWCGVHGKCVDINLCECHRGWRGKLCNKTIKYSDESLKEGNLSRKKRKRRLRHSGSPPFRFELKKKKGQKKSPRPRTNTTELTTHSYSYSTEILSTIRWDEISDHTPRYLKNPLYSLSLFSCPLLSLSQCFHDLRIQWLVDRFGVVVLI